ncbi:MAG: hypothetical protein JST79_01785 [Acidobacteria bacterium]|jgi:ribosomal subunit interface protein|nr:hypothetical protein [Acidobacteriota bacterium]
MQMQTRIQGADINLALQSYVDRRLRFALSRFGDRVGQITTRLFRQNGAVPAMTCRIEAEMVPFGSIRVEECDQDVFCAIDRATGRIGRLFAQRLERAHDSRIKRHSIRVA